MGVYEVEEMRQILAESINRMPEREKIVLTLYYYEGLTLAEIGRVLGVLARHCIDGFATGSNFRFVTVRLATAARSEQKGCRQ